MSTPLADAHREALGLSRLFWFPTEAEHQRRNAEEVRLLTLLAELYTLDGALDWDQDADVESYLARRVEVVVELGRIYDPLEHGRRVLTADCLLVDPRSSTLHRGWVELYRCRQLAQMELAVVDMLLEVK